MLILSKCSGYQIPQRAKRSVKPSHENCRLKCALDTSTKLIRFLFNAVNRLTGRCFCPFKPAADTCVHTLSAFGGRGFQG